VVGALALDDLDGLVADDGLEALLADDGAAGGPPLGAHRPDALDRVPERLGHQGDDHGGDG